MLAVVTCVCGACVISVFDPAFPFFLIDLSDMVHVRSMGIAVSGFVVIDFLGPWLSASNMKVLLFGRDAADFIILVMLPSTTSIHSPSYCSLSFPFPPRRQSLLSSFLSSFTALALIFGHLSSFPFLNSFAFTYLSPICLHTLAYRKHTSFLFHMH